MHDVDTRPVSSRGFRDDLQASLIHSIAPCLRSESLIRYSPVTDPIRIYIMGHKEEVILDKYSNFGRVQEAGLVDRSSSWVGAVG